MRTFLIKIVSFSIPVIAVLLLVNYIGDPARIFDSDYEKNIAELIGEGKHVTDIGNYDERILQKELISKWTSPPDIAVLGSSRMMQLRSSHFPEHSFFNNAVSSARIYDLIGLYQLYKDKGIVPEKIMIGIDPPMFDIQNEDERWRSIAASYYKFKKLNAGAGLALYKYKQLLSFTYFQSSVEALVQDAKGIYPKEAENQSNVGKTKLSDGSLVYGEKIRKISANGLENKVNNYLNYDIKSFERFDSIAGPSWKDFEILIEDMKSNNVEVEFFLSPYHPKVYKAFSSQYQIVLEVEKKIRAFSLKNGIKVYGSYDPRKHGLNEDYFFDGLHPKGKAIQKILQDEGEELGS